MPDTSHLLMRDLVDGQLESTDGRKLGRVADVEAQWRPDGTLVLTDLVVGPQALAGRVSSHLRPIVRALLGDRFEHRIPVDAIAKVGPTVRLRGRADQYDLGHADEWVVERILRFIPGSGR